MRLAIIVTLAAGSIACGDSPFADPDNPMPVECTAIEDRWLDVATSLDRSCTDDTDCVLIGDGGYCEGGQTSLGPCWGFAVNRQAAEAAQGMLADAARGWDSCSCDLVECSIDCELGEAICQGSTCTAIQLSCNPPEPP